MNQRVLYHLECPHCHYSAVVSGGMIVGKNVITRTIVCRTCRELIEARVAARTGLTWTTQDAVCNKDATHDVEGWVYNGHCPRCSSTMRMLNPTPALD